MRLARAKSRSANTWNSNPALAVEALERRDTPAPLPTAALVGGTIVIQGTDAADTVTVRMDYDGPSAFDDRVVVLTGSPTAPTQSFARFLVGRVGFLGAGDDTFTNQTGLACAAWGGNGNDTLTGESGDDRLYGNNGADELRGGDGGDKVSGGAGDDLLDDWCDPPPGLKTNSDRSGTGGWRRAPDRLA